ncbi:MAG: bestrophin [Myxococcales bacterium]|nr:bestrophin [Myxococcales bacterium]
MLVRPTRAFPGTMFMLRGSALSHIWLPLVAVSANATALWVTHEWMAAHKLTLTATPFSILGVALSIFLGFRNNACYDRWWEARKLWGLLINRSRIVARQVLTLADTSPETHRELVYRQIAFVHALRLHLREQLDRLDELVPFLGVEEVARLRTEGNVPNAVLHTTGERVRDLWKAGQIDTFHLPVVEASLTVLADIQGGCERIKNTPVPLAYTILTHRIVGLYCVTLPLGLLDTVGVLTPVVVAIVSFAFLGLDSVGTQIEDPFEEDPNDLPLHAISRMIEVDLRQRLGETDLPPRLKPVDGVLL